MQKYLKKLYPNTLNDLSKELDSYLKNNEKKFIITVNPETLMMSKKDEEISCMLDNDEFILVPDGVSLVKACKLKHINIKERIPGIDIASILLKKANDSSLSIYLFGATKEINDALVNKIKEEYPNIKILGATHGYVKDKDKVMKNIAKVKPDICMVALGIPLQEKLIYENYKDFEKGIFIGVGGSFDCLSGMKKRAPKIFIKLNLEWLYRITTEPKRLKRFWDSNIKFMFEIILKK